MSQPQLPVTNILFSGTEEVAKGPHLSTLMGKGGGSTGAVQAHRAHHTHNATGARGTDSLASNKAPPTPTNPRPSSSNIHINVSLGFLSIKKKYL